MELILVILKWHLGIPIQPSFTRGAQQIGAARSSHCDVHVQMLLPLFEQFTAFIPPCTCMYLHFRVPIKIHVTLS